MSTEAQKVSRYRALRGKSVSESRKAIDDALSDTKQDLPNQPGSLMRRSAFGSRVMKRRSKTLSQIDTSGIQDITAHFPLPPVPHVPLSHDVTSRPNVAIRPSPPVLEKEKGHLERVEESNKPHESTRVPPPPPFTFPLPTAVTTDAAKDGNNDADWDQREPEEQKGRLDEEEAARLADRLEAETDRILAEQKKLDIARLHQQLLANHPAVSLTTTPTKPKSPMLEKLNFFNRGRSSKAATLSPTSSTTTSVDFSRAQSLDPALTPRAFFETGGPCMLMTPPLSPMSLNQAPERNVIVRYRGLSVNLTFVADTSTVDILFQASDSVTHPINTAASVVYECYAQLGLERRLRRYERIRDVLNSWDRDTQNTLLILPSISADSDSDLDISSVSTSQMPPGGFVLQLHHSSRPGKWNKRWITLSENGQILSSKRAAPGKDSQRLCHLSDYDIYTLMSKSTSPTEQAGVKSASSVFKNLKPPKKFVYAVKSQQKTMAHGDTANFVHFFCTDDPTVAHKFHASVHAWRSWYMVKARREVQRQRLLDSEKDKPPQIMSVKHKMLKSVSHVKVPGQGHRIRVSVDETPYTIGEFQPLVDLQRFDKPIDEFGKDWIPDPRLSTMISPDDIIAAATANVDAAAAASSAATPTATATTAPDVVTPAATPTVEEVVMTGLWGTSPEAQERRRKQAEVLRKASASAEAAQRQPAANGSQPGVSIAVLSPSEATTPSASPTKSHSQGSSSQDSSSSDPSSSSSPKPEPRSWLPSASEHTAKIKAEQERLERLYTPPRQQQPQRPSTSSGIAHSQRHAHSQQQQHGHQQYSPPYARQGVRQGGGSKRGAYPPGLGDMAGHVRAASQWADLSGSPSSSRPRFLEVPDGRSGMSMAAMSGSPRKPSSPSSGHMINSRPSTSGGERGRQGGPGQQQLRSRTGSVSSMRRVYGGIGAPPLGSLPPVPPMPPMPEYIRPVTRDGCGGGGGGGGGSLSVGSSPARTMSRDAGRSLTARHV
ncbi:hypothetical protein VM1G_07344 [Cytospora mali]|uniref:PH domain-containing protein n=1 Tax=Cytospora mali TaxID=578113 RepID=A0A194W5H7_CYTMA|nr:hypothetical protein VM1G_07344 [Valsa mali]